MRVKMIANWMYSWDPMTANIPNPLAISNESIAVGPTESCLDDPNNAYII